ncbi:MAG TPA: hypothetical protein VGK19_23005 [Capsulimonadaceae bacterium]|jgi:sRNA-binding carbon storage regulator CsrA
MQTGDRFEISVIDAGNGNVTLGISAPDRKPFRKAIVEDNALHTAKHFGSRPHKRAVAPAPPPAAAAPFVERRRAR